MRSVSAVEIRHITERLPRHVAAKIVCEEFKCVRTQVAMVSGNMGKDEGAGRPPPGAVWRQGLLREDIHRRTPQRAVAQPGEKSGFVDEASPRHL